MDELKITKEKVLAAAAKCSTAKEVLKEMFPEVFKEESIIPNFKTIQDASYSGMLMKSSEFNDAIFLNSDKYSWSLENRLGSLYLVAKKTK